MFTEGQQEILRPRKWFVEFGHGGKPAPIIFNDEFNLATNYIGIDTQTKLSDDKYQIEDLQKALARPNVAFIEGNKPFYEHDPHSGKLIAPESHGQIIGNLTDKPPIINDLGMLRFKDCSVDSVLMANLLGSPRVENTQNIQLIWEDALRIIKIGGELIILETRSPYNLPSLQTIINLYKLKIKKLVLGSDPDFLSESAPYNALGIGDNRALWNVNYLLIAEKQSPTAFDAEAHFKTA